MKYIYGVLTGLMVLGGLPMACFGQDGSDIATAIPIYFGQTINDTIDSRTRCCQVYSISLSKGQQVSIQANGSSGLRVDLYDSSYKTASFSNYLSSTGCCSATRTLNYQVAATGLYYIQVATNDTGVTFRLQVTAQGTPIVPANPAQAGCVTGQVDNITYSLQLVAAGLPDTVSIGGTQLCSSCSVKPPAYPLLVSKLETAMSLNVGVSACYDSSGNIFQLKLNHP